MKCLLNSALWAAVVIGCLAIASGPVVAADDGGKKSTESKEQATPETDESKESVEETASAEPEAEVVKLQGTLEAVKSWELTHGLDQFGQLEIKKILPHGAKVKKGQAVIWFDTEAIDEKMTSSEIEIRLARLAAEDDQFAYDQFVAAQKLDREDAEQARKAAKQAYDNYMQVDRDRKIKSAEFDIKMSQASLDNVMEELKQLQQMYDADDLTEESEEIVLKRAKQSVESAEFRLESTKIRSERTLEQSIPAEDAQKEAAWERAQIAYEKAVRDLESAKKKRDLERRKAADALAKKEADYEELREQRKSIVVQAPGDGILLYGELNRGALNAKPSPIEAGSKVSPDQVIATLVQPGKLRVRLTLSEADVAKLNAGDRCTVNPTIDPDLKLKGSLESISPVPFMGTQFDAVVKISGKVDDSVVPTTKASVEFEPMSSTP
ncbi:HlyD family efflux transporter periplasmic adaptor subunit [Rhodopirellula sp. JC740]|uniref:HlyD family efflux transporter periplasmic adaptor subunit n=1 Tax=Rhodopirellula halodulae TaxID=2894198 RepID=A0ABS8NC54_9BACT|nr:HlyD family secretion protein [Rhodopirellula sp. JC740]MCC9641119.1 HlyD family efflux transporter periplasmic adaptor subunit [Rhodopirellula sp. JC740]